jgi:polysaccharide biosynthesis/export protein
MVTKSFTPTTLLSLAIFAICIGPMGRAQTSAGSGPVPSASMVSADTTNPTGNTTQTVPQFQQRTSRYRIEPGDTFDLTFELSPEYNQTAVAVQPDGFVTLRGIGDIKVSGQTIPELTETVKQAYEKIMNKPLISIVLKDFEKPYFVADGQVAKPGKYEMHGNVTVTQAIAIAGGFQSSAKHSQVVLFRRVDDQWTEAKLIDVKKMENRRDLREDPVLHPGDMLFVPKNVLSKIDRIIPNLSAGSYVPIQLQ